MFAGTQPEFGPGLKVAPQEFASKGLLPKPSRLPIGIAVGSRSERHTILLLMGSRTASMAANQRSATRLFSSVLCSTVRP
ncbi:hypothetical protein D3C72_2022450 [compost metagenome]